LDEDQKQILLRDKEFDFSFAFGDLGRFRVNAFHERSNLAAALRLIPNEIKSIKNLGLPPIVSSFADYPRGLVLVTGPTGSGKSSTLAALVDKINTERAQHIITKPATWFSRPSILTALLKVSTGSSMFSHHTSSPR
jgi:twitching motility protein PilT